MSPRKIGILFGGVFLAFWSVVISLGASEYWGAFPAIVFIVVPIASLVSWRGSVLASGYVVGETKVSKFVFDGAKWGAIVGLVLITWSVYSQLYAAGHPLDGATVFSYQFWTYVLYIVIPVCGFGALLGAIHGLIFFYAYRWVNATNK